VKSFRSEGNLENVINNLLLQSAIGSSKEALEAWDKIDKKVDILDFSNSIFRFAPQIFQNLRSHDVLPKFDFLEKKF